MIGVFKESCAQNLCKKFMSLENWKKQAPQIKLSYRILRNRYFFMKITIDDVEYVSKLYIKFCLKRLKNEFLMNILLELGFLLYTRRQL